MPEDRRHQEVKELFCECCELEPEARARRLDEVERGDPDLAVEVRAMFEFEARKPAFLDGQVAGREEEARQDEVLPDSIGPYRVLRRIGEGGMGTVYEVQQESPRRTIALKLLRPGSTRMLRRFELEGEILGRLEHPGVARIYESGSFETDFGVQPYLAMELIDGVPLTRWAHARSASPEERIALMASVCDAVQHAHQHGVIHRDLKPANILVDARGQPHILDFGIARAVDSDIELTLQTDVGEIVGTLAYMSPEQASGDPKAIDTRSDVYSLGVLLYELLAEQLPYDVSSRFLPDALEAIRQAEPRRLSGVHRLFRGDIETIVRKALEKDKERRYPSAAALAADLRHFLDHEPIEARPPSRIYHLRKFVRRHRVLVGATAAVGLALTIGLSLALHFGIGEARQRVVAEENAQLSLEAGNFEDARAQLLTTPEELRGWEWSALESALNREIASLSAPDTWLAAYLDDERVVVVDERGGGLLWDTVTGETSPLPAVGPSKNGLALALSGDGRRLLTHADGSLLVHDTLEGTIGHTVPFPETPEHNWRSSALSSCGTKVAVTAEDQGVWLVHLEPVPRVERIREPGREVQHVAFTSDGRLLAITGASFLSVRSTASRQPLWELNINSILHDAIAFDLERGRAATSTGPSISVRDLETGEALETWRGPKLGIMRLASPFDLDYSPDGSHLAAMFRGGVVFVLDAETGDVRYTLDHPGDFRRGSIVFAPDGATLLTCNRSTERDEREVKLWAADTETSGVLTGHTETIEDLVATRDGRFLITGSWDETARVWDASTGLQIGSVANGNRVRCLAVSPDGRRLARGLGKRSLDVWDLPTGQLLSRHPGIAAASLAYSPDGSLLAVGHPDRALKLLDPETLEVRRRFEPAESRATAVDWSPDGTLLATGGSDGSLELWDVATGECLATVRGSREGARDQEGVRSIDFSPDGTRLVTGWGSSEVILYDVPALDAPRALVGHKEEVFSVAFAPDGRRIATGGRDGLLRLWDPGTGGMLGCFRGHGSYIRALAFTPDGRRIATASGDTTVRIWDTAPRSGRWGELRLARRQHGATPPQDARPVEASFEKDPRTSR